MDNNKHVYCTNCLNFRLSNENIPYCAYEDRCEIRNCEDSMRFKFRPYYKPMICSICGKRLDDYGIFKCSKCNKLVCCQCFYYDIEEVISAEEEGRESVGKCAECACVEH